MDPRPGPIDAGSHIVATIGISDLIVIDTPDATLISSMKHAHKVSKIVKELKDSDREEHAENRKVFRPWGWYDSIESGKNFQVKRLHVNPKSKLSLQLHHKRAEHWVVVEGIANITLGEDPQHLENLELHPNQSTYIPIGFLHRLENKQQTPLVIIEVQTGEYLGEDDIERYEDLYGRNVNKIHPTKT